MAEISLTPKNLPERIPLEADSISCDVFAGKDLAGIKNLPIFVGNKEKKLEDYFDIQGTSADNAAELKIIINGNVNNVKYIGKGMTAGEIIIKGSAGMHTADWLNGGKITVEGDVGNFSATEMKKGELVIKGSAGHYLGSAYRGNWSGMMGGKIIVEGNVGMEAGAWMKGKSALLKIRGNADILLGIHQHRGVIIVEGDVAPRAGAEMAGGTIVVLGKVEELLPSFKYIEEVPLVEISENEAIKGPFLKFQGDLAQRPASKQKGAIYAKKEKNGHLM